MTSEKQIEANRKNAKKSTGPKTEEGKAKCSQNALVHGLSSQSLMHPGIDNVAEFQTYTKKLYDCFNPKNEVELFFVNRAISCMWRLRRIVNIEEAIFNEEIKPGDINIPEKIFLYIKEKMSVIGKYETGLERSLYKTLNQLKKLQDI